MADDLNFYAPTRDTATVHLRNPETDEVLKADDEGNPMWVEVYGVDSERYREVDHEIADRNLSQLMSRRNKQKSLRSKDIFNQETERLARCIKSWHVVVGGELLEYSENVAKELLGNPRLAWLREQVKEGIEDRERYLGN